MQDFFQCSPSPCWMHPPAWAQKARSLYMEKSTWLLWAVIFHLSGTTSLFKAGYKLKIIARKISEVWMSGERGTLHLTYHTYTQPSVSDWEPWARTRGWLEENTNLVASSRKEVKKKEPREIGLAFVNLLAFSLTEKWTIVNQGIK